MQFKIVGSPFRNKMWRRVNSITLKYIKNTEDNIIDVSKITFPSPFCVLIRYEILNFSEKYELVFQGDYQDKFRAYKDLDNDPLAGLDEDGIETLIRTNHKRAKRIFTSTKNS